MVMIQLSYRVATVLTVYGIEIRRAKLSKDKTFSCNSTYRLRY